MTIKELASELSPAIDRISSERNTRNDFNIMRIELDDSREERSVSPEVAVRTFEIFCPGKREFNLRPKLSLVGINFHY